MANQSVKIPRIYIDYTQLAKAKGFWKDLMNYDIENTRGVYELDEEGLEVYGEKNMNVWNFDYSNPTLYTHRGGDNSFNFRLGFWDPSAPSTHSLEWAKFISTTTWVGALNHNFASSFNTQTDSSKYLGVTVWNPNTSEEIGFNKTDSINGSSNTGTAYGIQYDGYSFIMGEFNNNIYLEDGGTNESGYSAIIATIVLGDASYGIYPDQEFSLGSLAFGKHIDLIAPDLNITKSISYEGVELQRSLSGADYTNINYLGSPDWLNGEPWVLSRESEGMARIGKNGRRSWDLSFSYISNDDLFYDHSQQNASGVTEYNESGEENNFYATSEIQQIWDLTLGGSLPFIFTPDKDATNPEFCVCRFKDKVLKAEQVAFQTWNIEVTIEEVW